MEMRGGERKRRTSRTSAVWVISIGTPVSLTLFYVYIWLAIFEQVPSLWGLTLFGPVSAICWILAAALLGASAATNRQVASRVLFLASIVACQWIGARDVAASIGASKQPGPPEIIVSWGLITSLLVLTTLGVIALQKPRAHSPGCTRTRREPAPP